MGPGLIMIITDNPGRLIPYSNKSTVVCLMSQMAPLEQGIPSYFNTLKLQLFIGKHDEHCRFFGYIPHFQRHQHICDGQVATTNR